MNFKEILELIDKVAERGIGAVEIEQAGTKLRIEGKSTQPQVIHSFVGGDLGGSAQAVPQVGGGALPTLALPPAAPPTAADIARAEEESEAGLHIITSPMVGTFYRSANPEAEPYVSVGDHISKGKVLCIIEAMKLMNQYEAEVDGTIVRIYPQNGQPVEYGEKLFAVRP